jgi:hypothetical protein
MAEAYGFFYGIETSHFVKIDGDFYQVQGFGITTSPKKRVSQYSDHAGTEQEFHALYFGPITAIKSLENIVKQMLSSKSHNIYGQKVEWVTPKSPFDKKDLIDLVENIIHSQNLQVEKVKNTYLPFDNSAIHKKLTIKQIANNPAKYLDVRA